MTTVVVGQLARDLALRTAGVPAVGASTAVLDKREGLGGKGANQAVGLAQLGIPVALIAVAGADAAGGAVLDQAVADGIDVRGVVRRGDSALLIDLVDDPPQRRLFEDVPDTALLTEADIERSRALLAAADTVSIQLQQPPAAALAAARLARAAGVRVVTDGVADDAVRDELLTLTDVARLDAEEAAIVAGQSIESVAAAADLGEELIARGPRLVAVEVHGVGDLLIWPGGRRLLAISDDPVVDPTGAGDAFVAGMIAALHRGAGPEPAGELASAAARRVVARLGGRPDLHGL